MKCIHCYIHYQMHSSNQYEVFIVKVIDFMPELQACFYINLWYEPKQCLFPSIYSYVAVGTVQIF